MLKGGLLPFPRTGRVLYAKAILSYCTGIRQVRPPASEESKVKLWHRVSLLSDLKKRGASRVAHFLHSIFKEQAPPQSGEGSLLRWYWSFTGASRAVAARTGATLVVVPQQAQSAAPPP